MYKSCPHSTINPLKCSCSLSVKQHLFVGHFGFRSACTTVKLNTNTAVFLSGPLSMLLCAEGTVVSTEMNNKKKDLEQVCQVKYVNA